MKKFIAVSLLLAATSYAETELETIQPLSIAPSSTVTYTVSYPMTGQLKDMVLATSGGSATVTVTTVASKGLTVGAARTLLPASVIAPSGLETNVNGFVGNDKIVFTASSATATGTVVLKAGFLVYK